MLEEKAIHKIEQDYDEFRNKMYDLSPEKMYVKAYKIFIVTEMYMLLKSDYKLTQKMLKNIVLHRGNLFDFLFYEWTCSEFSERDEIKTFIRYTLKGMQKVVKLCA